MGKGMLCSACSKGVDVYRTPKGTCNRRRQGIGIRMCLVSHLRNNLFSIEYDLGKKIHRCMTVVYSDLNKSRNRSPQQQQPGTVATCCRGTDAEAVVEQALVYLRKNDFESLESLLDLTDHRLLDSYTSSRLGLTDGGVLSRYATYFDAGSRRLLPSNLLRRSRVTGALRFTKDIFHVRMTVTSKSGEEGVILWRLRRASDEEHHHGKKRNKGWVVEHVSKEETVEEEQVADAGRLPRTPHPRYSCFDPSIR